MDVGEIMGKTDFVVEFDKPEFIVKLSEYVLQVDLKEGSKKKLEDILEQNPVLGNELGFIFSAIVPLDVWLKDIEAVKVDREGRTKLVIPHHRDITIPLEKDETKKLIDKLNELIPLAKQKDKEEKQIRRKLHINL